MNDGADALDLIAEIERYLAAIAVFRAERCEPTWLPEPISRPSVGRPKSSH
jgi:hypothetical protein